MRVYLKRLRKSTDHVNLAATRDPGCLWLGIKDNKDEFRLSNMYGGWLNDAITSIHCSW